MPSSDPPFDAEAGDTVTYVRVRHNRRDLASAEFVRWNRKGDAVLRIRGRERVVTRDLVRPCNDGRMVRKRGYVQWPPVS